MQINLNHDSRNQSKFKRNFSCTASKCTISYFIFVCWCRHPCSWWRCFKSSIRYTWCSYIRTNWGRWLHLCCSKWSLSCCRSRLIQILKWNWIYTVQPNLMAAVQLLFIAVWSPKFWYIWYYLPTLCKMYSIWHRDPGIKLQVDVSMNKRRTTLESIFPFYIEMMQCGILKCMLTKVSTDAVTMITYSLTIPNLRQFLYLTNPSC